MARGFQCDGPAGAAVTREVTAVAFSREVDTGSREENASNKKVLFDQIVFEDRHLELERAVVVFIVDEQNANEFLADIDLGRVVLFRARYHADLGIAEQALEIGVEFPD